MRISSQEVILFVLMGFNPRTCYARKLQGVFRVDFDNSVSCRGLKSDKSRKILCVLPVSGGSCSETEVSEQL
jgi:hypothetical protein